MASAPSSLSLCTASPRSEAGPGDRRDYSKRSEQRPGSSVGWSGRPRKRFLGNVPHGSARPWFSDAKSLDSIASARDILFALSLATSHHAPRHVQIAAVSAQLIHVTTASTPRPPQGR